MSSWNPFREQRKLLYHIEFLLSIVFAKDKKFSPLCKIRTLAFLLFLCYNTYIYHIYYSYFILFFIFYTEGQMSSNKNNAAYREGDCVIYKSNGICRINEIQKKSFAGEEHEYYVLQSLFDGHSTWYVPLDSQELVSSMSHILCAEEINALIDSSAGFEDIWEDDYKKRNEKFTDIIKHGDRAEVMSLFKTLSLHKKEAESQRRKLYVSDERVLHSAEKMITEEFSYVLDIPRAQVLTYILNRLGKENE